MQFYSSLPPQDAALLSDIVKYLDLWLAFRDPPDHTRVRRILRHAFTPKAVDAMRPGSKRSCTTCSTSWKSAKPTAST
ncbi:hypothetical protein ACFSZS_17655 [Seohaeicola zhoushanensis]